jgi:hypothetical protein
MDQNTDQPITSLPEQDKLPLVGRLGRSRYDITDPDPAWLQRSFLLGQVECSKCGDTLTFCFPPRIDPQTAGFAGSYQTPVGVRCNCFLAEPISAEPASSELLIPASHRALARQPVAIVAFKSTTQS